MDDPLIIDTELLEGRFYVHYKIVNMMAIMQIICFGVFTFVITSCRVLQTSCPSELARDKHKWENRKKAIEHYNLDLKASQDFYLIESSVGWNLGHWGCFYLGDSTYCFSQPDPIKPIEFKPFVYDDFIVESLKEGNIDTLLVLSKSPDHKIVSPATSFILIRYVNGVYEEYQMNAFTVNPELPPDDL